MTIDLSGFSGGGGDVEVGRVLITANSSIGGNRDVIPCDGSDVDASLYPSLAAILSESFTPTSVTQNVSANIAGSSNKEIRTAASDSSGAALVSFSASTGTPISITRIVHVSDCFNAAGATVVDAGGLNPGSFQYPDSYGVAIKANGTQALFAYMDNTPVLRVLNYSGGTWSQVTFNRPATTPSNLEW